MKKTILALIAILLVLTWGLLAGKTLINENKILFEEAQKIKKENETIKENLKKHFKHYKLLDKIIEKESSGRVSVWGDSHKQYKAFGAVQFQERTFYWLSEKAGFNGNWKNPDDQIELLDWAIRNNYGYLWSTYKNAKKSVNLENTKISKGAI